MEPSGIYKEIYPEHNSAMKKKGFALVGQKVEF